MKRFLAAVAGTYIGVALVTRGMEGTGPFRCQCRPECWCKKPGLTLFRWVFPFGHSLPGVGS